MTLSDLIRAALNEDMPNGDLTTDCLGLAPRFGQARLIAKQDLILSGATAFEQTIETLEPNSKTQWHFREGDKILNRQIICHITGDLIQLLKAERVALNFIGHLSGIATLTSQFVEQVRHTSTKILDTRKTLPGHRELEKKAVTHGGGVNHRHGLSDGVLIKENHIMVAGGARQAVERIRMNTDKKIEIECATFEATKEALSLDVDQILLDNMNTATMSQTVALTKQYEVDSGKKVLLEASGNMTLERVRSVAETGVDFISVGALTHSAPNADISLLFDWQQSEMTGI